MKYKFILIALVLFGCNPQVTVGLHVDFDDPCLFAFPECDGTCTDSRGAVVTQCEPACLAGRRLVCTVDGPHCSQDFGPDPVFVPVLCVNPTIYTP